MSDQVERIESRTRLEELYGAQMAGMVCAVKEKVRLHGYWVSKEVLYPKYDGTPSRSFQTARDPWALSANPAEVILLIWQHGSESVMVEWKVRGSEKKGDQQVCEVQLVQCRAQHPEIGRILASWDLKEVLRRLTWHLKDLVHPPSPKHWWPAKRQAQ